CSAERIARRRALTVPILRPVVVTNATTPARDLHQSHVASARRRPVGARGECDCQGVSVMFFGKTFSEKQRERRGAQYDADMRKVAALRAAAERVCWFDWSSNDPDAVAAI